MPSVRGAYLRKRATNKDDCWGAEKHLASRAGKGPCRGRSPQDALKSSKIEGELLDPDPVRSSIVRRLGMDIAGLKPAERGVAGVVEIMLDAKRG